MMEFIFNKMLRTVGNFNMLIWFLLSASILVLLYSVYITFMRMILRKMKVPDKIQTCLSEIIWLICFNAMSIFVIIISLNIRTMELFHFSTKWTNDLENQLDDCKIHNGMTHPGAKTIFILHSSFYILLAIHTWYYKGLKNTDFFQNQSMFAAYTIAYFSECSMLGITVLLLASRITLLELIAKLLYLIGSITKSNTLRKTAMAVCLYHLCIWMETFLFTFPMFLSNNKSITSRMTQAKLNILITLDILIWLYVFVSIFNSVFSRTLLSLVLPTQYRPFTFEYCLFGWEDLQTDTPRPVKPIRTLFPRPHSDIEEVVKDTQQSLVTKRNLNLIASTIRCSIVMKRKLRHLRERKSLARTQANINTISPERKVGATEMAY